MQPRKTPIRRPFWNFERLAVGLKACGGNVSQAAEFLRNHHNRPLGRSTIFNMLRANPALRQIRIQAEGQLFDVCAEGVSARAQKGNPRDQRLVYNKLVKRHGAHAEEETPPTKIELTGADGKPVAHHHEVHADGGLTKEQLAALDREALRTIVAAERIKYAQRVATAIAAAGGATEIAGGAAHGPA